MINMYQAQEFIEKYFDFNKLKKLIENCKYENSVNTGEGCYVCTLISGSAGSYMTEEFLTLISEVLGIKFNIQDFIEDTLLVYDILDKINDELEGVFEEQGIDTVNYDYWIGFNEIDGALDLFMRAYSFGLN